jgi:hypothetical protein
MREAPTKADTFSSPRSESLLAGMSPQTGHRCKISDGRQQEARLLFSADRIGQRDIRSRQSHDLQENDYLRQHNL